MNRVKLLVSLLLLSAVAYFTFQLEEELTNQVEVENQTLVKSSHKEAIGNIESAISSYYFIVAAVKAYTKTLNAPPTETELQEYIADYTNQIGFQDSILLSFLDSNHKFVYTVGPDQLDPVGLSGLNISWFRDSTEIAFLDSVMQIETINLNQPINLVERWPAFPFSFHLKYDNDIIYGYIAAVLNIEYLTKKVYNENHDSRIYHRFIVNDSIDFTDVAVYDGTTIYNFDYDSIYYKNNNLIESDFIYSSDSLFGHKFTLGTTLKKGSSNFKPLNYIFEAYCFLAFVILFLIWRLSRKTNRNKIK